MPNPADPKAIDISPEAVGDFAAEMRRNLFGYGPGIEKCRTAADLLSALSAALSEARGKVGEAERERDNLRAALQITTPTVRFDDRHRAAFTLLASIARYDWNDEPSIIRRALDDFVEQARELTISPSVDPTAGYVDSLTAAIASRDAALSERNHLVAAYEAALAELEKLRAEAEWRPIESAPEHEKVLIALHPYDDPDRDAIVLIATCGEGYWTEESDPDTYLYQPTAWRPLPSPPKDLAK